MTPDDYEQLYAESLDEPAFSNSDEGYAWLDANCARCIHDKPAREGDDGNGCPLILISLMGRRPIQWLDGPRDERGLYSREGQYHCVEFRHEDDGPGPEPTPLPDPPGQCVLLPREDFEGVRMLTPQPESQAVSTP